MKLMVGIFLCLFAGSIHAQTSVKSPLPLHCTPGDYVDSYVGGSRCIDTDKWETDRSLFSDAGGEGGSGQVMMGYTPSWRPDCSAAFQDVLAQWHCPFETATGRVVGCTPCGSRHAADGSCLSWYQECLKRVEIMKTHLVVEASSLDIPVTEQTDHTQRRSWSCPTGYTMEYLGPRTEDEIPICEKEKP